MRVLAAVLDFDMRQPDCGRLERQHVLMGHIPLDYDLSGLASADDLDVLVDDHGLLGGERDETTSGVRRRGRA